MKDSTLRDKIFSEKLLGDKAVVLVEGKQGAIDKLKDYLVDHISSKPYNWDGNPMLRDIIDGLAKKEYASDGYQKAFQKIDNMNADDVKMYLKGLIKNNMNVGIEIIKDN